MKFRKRPAVIAVAALTATTLVACSSDDADGDASYPDRDLRIIVPYDAGGASDLAARTLAGEMEESLGVSIIVENRSGGAGSVGLAALADADPDGYTLGYMPVEVVMLGQQGYDTDHTDYEYLGQIVSVPATIGVPADSPYQTLQDLIDAATENPDTITVGNSGAGSIWHAATTLLNEETGAQLRPVPFDGGAPAVTAAIGGQVDAVVAGVSETAQAHADGQLRVLAVLAEEPADALPDVPTAIDEGIDVAIGGWGMLGAPAGVPDEVIDVLGEAVEEAVASEAYTDVITSAGNIPLWRNPADATAFVNEQAEVFAGLLAE
ncbi:tripartite tricarboxylate transporter substrate binding protein [uncultured Georgenia sp.]|uniref:Bug family tripartite tricarboxylate transporter substrate binding protein n=1 Tax=uncultured Georgenia sp. TaxID=378209 RepID=UPI0026340807|nr:tripartite tricarboxylate transporter substrate binding protein [uncultured Georgenia sp.]HLV04465.1 tripartite tricarboxylate transporter substrate binding protein [Actinomycetaceae bacterium]